MDQESRLYYASGIGKRLVPGMTQAANFVGIILRAMLFWDMTSCHTPEDSSHQQLHRWNLYIHRYTVSRTGTICVTEHWGAFVQPLLLWESNEHYILWVCLCSLIYSACNAHTLYCHLWPARLYWIFPHYLLKGTIFGEKRLLNTKRLIWIHLQLFSEQFFILRIIRRDMIKNVYWS